MKDVDENEVQLPVAQYISLDMGGDGFKFHKDLYNQILQEALDHLDDEGFVAETYFSTHSNPEITQYVFKDLLSFRTHYIAQRIIEVQQEFAKNPTNRELLQEFVKLKQMNALVASQTNSVFN